MESKNLKTTWEPIKILTKTDTSKEVSVENIPWLNIEQLYVGQEVKKPTEIRGQFNTNDASLTRVNNFYNLNVPDPEWEIFSFSIDGIDMVFSIGNFWGNPTLAYEKLETQLQEQLWDIYTVEYVWSGDFTIVKQFEKTVSFSELDLVRTITLTDWDNLSIIDITIDWVTISIDWQNESTANDALDYFTSQIDSSLYYYSNSSWWAIQIARKDTSIPVISFSTTDRNTYRLSYEYSDTPSTWQFLDYVDTTIDALTVRYTEQVTSRAYYWNQIIDNLRWERSESSTFIWSEVTRTPWDWLWIRILNKTPWGIITNYTAQETIDTISIRLLDDSGTVLETQTPVSWVVSFTTSLSENTYYRIETQTDDNKYRGDSISWDNEAFTVSWGSLNWVNNSTIFNLFIY